MEKERVAISFLEKKSTFEQNRIFLVFALCFFGRPVNFGNERAGNLGEIVYLNFDQ